MTNTSVASNCVVIVPCNFGIEPACERGLTELESRGYEVRRVSGFAAIDQCRNQAATDALAAGFDEIVWIDADVVFDPEAVDRLRSHDLPIVCGIYPKKSMRALACTLSKDAREIHFGERGGLIEIEFTAAGFLYTRRSVYDRVQHAFDLPVCNQQFGEAMVPYFLPMVVGASDGPHYLAEDFAFSHRVREAGFKIIADTTIRLGHVGKYTFFWEDAGEDRTRYRNYRYYVKRENRPDSESTEQGVPRGGT